MARAVNKGEMILNARGGATGTETGSPALSEEQLSAVEELKKEIRYYEDLRKKAENKRSKVKNILDNFEAVVVGEIVVDILPDETSEEIINSFILSKNDIINKLNGINTYDPNIDNNVSFNIQNYSGQDIYYAKTILNNIFQQPLIKDLLSISTVLRGEELYIPLYYQMIQNVSGAFVGKEILRNVIEEIETDLL